MLPTILIGLGVVVVVFLIIVAMQPPEYTVTRATTIAAPPSTVFEQVNDLHNWEVWSPWAKLDPAAKKTYDGSPRGAGASFSWSGNKKIGEGRMTIRDSRPNELIRIDLAFVRPFPSTSTSEFTFAPEGDQTSGTGGTRVMWSMIGKKNFMSKAFCMFVNMDKMLGGDFEKGLASMKAATEATR